MSPEKVRDQFSALYEGSLSESMATAIREELRQNPSLAEDYRTFEQTMEFARTLAEVEAPIPADLHERISRRVDKYAYDRKSQSVAPFAVWWKSLIAGSLAVGGLLVATLTMNPSSGARTAGMVGGGELNQLAVSGSGSDVSVSLVSAHVHQVTIRLGVNGKVLNREADAPGRLVHRIRNPEDGPVLVSVNVSGDPEPLLLAIPGTQRSLGERGSGTVADLSLALADRYRMPVEVDSAKYAERVTWDLSAEEPIAAVGSILEPLGLTAEVRETGTLKILNR
ncbi:MAG: anti-sigma factor family protein [Fimbriimonadaceae bacterium]